MNQGVVSIFDNFSVTSDEYKLLEDAFEKLCYKANWLLKQKNYNNNMIDDHDDIAQNLRIKMLTAGAYHKRQIYIETCLKCAREHVTDSLMSGILNELDLLWENRKRHGASRQKFGDYQQQILETMIKKNVPKSLHPNKEAGLKIDAKFRTYCKTIIWNGQKTMGKKITKEKGIRGKSVSLSEFDYFAYI